MPDLSFYIFHYLNEFWRRWRSIVIITWTVGLLGVLLVAITPDYYTSRATVLMDTRSILTRILGKQVVFEDPIQQVEQVRRIMYARPSIETLIRRSDLDLRINSPRDMERMVESMQKNLILEREGDDFYRIQYDNADPEVAQRVVQNLLNLFIENNIGRVGNRNDTAISYLEAQAEDTQNRLTEIEAQIATFIRDNPNQLVDLSTISAQKQTLENNIRSLRTEKQFVTTEIAQLERELSSTPAQISAGGNLGQSPQQARLGQLIQERDALLLRLTPQHPDVISLNNLIEQVQSSGLSGTGFSQGSTTNNPMYAQLEQQLRRTKNRLITLDLELQNHKEDLQNIIETMAQQPSLQQAYTRLEESRRLVYNKLLQLKEQIQVATTSTSVTSDVNLVEFRVVEPPVLPLRPTGPNRFVLLMAVAIGAVLAGLSSAFLRIQLAGTMPTLNHLKDVFPYPILGGITKVGKENSSGELFAHLIIVSSAFILFILMFIILIYQFHTAQWRPNFNFLASAPVVLDHYVT